MVRLDNERSHVGDAAYGLRQLCFRRIPNGHHREVNGVLRLLTRELAWHGYVMLAFEELVTLGSSSPVVGRRLLAALDELIAVAPPERRAPLESQRKRLLSCAAKAGNTLVADVQGIGAARELMVG